MLKRFISYYKPHWKLFAADMVCAVLIAAVLLAAILLLQKLWGGEDAR